MREGGAVAWLNARYGELGANDLGVKHFICEAVGKHSAAAAADSELPPTPGERVSALRPLLLIRGGCSLLSRARGGPFATEGGRLLKMATVRHHRGGKKKQQMDLPVVNV